MGIAAKRRKESRKRYLAKLAAKNPELFACKWELRLTSWLFEIQAISKDWANGGEKCSQKIFGILDEALETLRGCGSPMYERFAEKTFNLIGSECGTKVAAVIDQRLYRLSYSNPIHKASSDAAACKTSGND